MWWDCLFCASLVHAFCWLSFLCLNLLRLVVLHKILASTVIKFSQLLVCKEVTSLKFWLKSSPLDPFSYQVFCFFCVYCYHPLVYMKMSSLYKALQVHNLILLYETVTLLSSMFWFINLMHILFWFCDLSCVKHDYFDVQLLLCKEGSCP